MQDNHDTRIDVLPISNSNLNSNPYKIAAVKYKKILILRMIKDEVPLQIRLLCFLGENLPKKSPECPEDGFGL